MSDEENFDANRRKFLAGTTTVVGGLGVAAVAVPFLSSWQPSEKTKSLGAPVKVDVSKISPGQKIVLSWRGKPIFVVKRTDSSLKLLDKVEENLRDPLSNSSIQPNYINDKYRAINKNILVIEALCTHLGCVPIFMPAIGQLEQSWLGGFFCPCHGSKYDLSGRVYKSVPAPTNLTVPPHHYQQDGKILVIGEDE